MSENPLLKHLQDANIGIAGSASKHFPINIERVLSEKGAQIVSFTVGHGPSGPFVTIPKQDVVIAPFDMELPGTMTGQILRWRLGNEQANSESVDIDDVSPNHFAKKVAELIDESKFKLPEWFEGYNFKWEGSVIDHPVTGERCRKLRLFKTFEEGNIREKYTYVYLDASGQLFNASKKRKAADTSKNRFAIGKEVIDRTQITENSTIEVHNSYRQLMVGNNEPTIKDISFFKNTEI
ncbi:hypothetical protein KA050_01455 [Candidatus Gracilibacteria bacterium]|nr:hypothetical protein [Candidatus Gracilibacteria bacterium]